MIFHFLKMKKFDFILLQETHSNQTDEKLWKCEWGGDIFYSHGTNHCNGVAILVKKSLKYEQTATYVDQTGRILLIEIKFNDKVFVIGNVYASTKDEPTFFDALFSTVVNFTKHDLVLGGDWNLVLDNKLDKDGGPAHSNQLSKEKVKSYLNVFDLCDVFRELNPFKKSLTRYQSQPYTATRLDFFLTSNGLRQHVQSANICQSIKSDHKIALLTIKVELQEWGKGCRKINNSVLLNDDYIALIKNLISDFEKNNPKGHVTPHIRWETLKCVIRGETIKYCSLLKKTSNKEQSVLESKLEAMESNLLSCGPKQKEEILNNINLTQNDLNKLIEIKTKGAATRSRARWMESGEKNTKYFLHLEKWHLEKNPSNPYAVPKVD